MTMIATHTPDQITQFKIRLIEPAAPEVRGYFVDSTAPINVEDQPDSDRATAEQTYQTIQSIAQYLVDNPQPQVVISIHGYGTKQSDAEERYQRIYTYATDYCPPNTSVFLGYHWPSEKPSGDPSIKTGTPPVPDTFPVKLKNAFAALPILPGQVFTGGLTITAIAAVSLMVLSPFRDLLFRDLLVWIVCLSLIPVSIILALILLRLSTYFRDNYRATNYGVPDLVELIRQLDLAVVQVRKSRGQPVDEPRIKLSFIGHSMGCFVVTNTIRILSDVFDPASVKKVPTPKIGNVFCLERLILVAPDIPVETVIPRRANFLRASLRRCQEAYIFSSEGDLAVRLASTAANYFSFPARTRFSGYRLGNLTVERGSHDWPYGIVNWQGDVIQAPYYCLELRSSDRDRQTLQDLRGPKEIEEENLDVDQGKSVRVSDLFTYFDCTDYVDIQDLPRDRSPASHRSTPQAHRLPVRTAVPEGVVTYARKKTALTLVDYLSLSLAYFLGWPRSINVHGGYFNGVFSQEVMYKLAFQGFSGLLTSLGPENLCPTDWQSLDLETRQSLLATLSQRAQDKGIQIVLAPSRYQQDILQSNKQT